MPPKGVLIGPNLHKRQMRLLRWGEDRMGTDKDHRKRTPEILGDGVVEFELLENLPQWATDADGNILIVQAARKTWDASAKDGEGGYTVDCTDIILVGDLNEVGHNADVGGFGMARVKIRKNSPEIDGVSNTNIVHVIFDLCCRGDEQGECETA